MKNMDAGQMDGMVNMMRQNPQMWRQQLETMNGMKFTDEQFNAMMQNITPENMRKAQDIAKNNPELIRQAHQQRQN